MSINSLLEDSKFKPWCDVYLQNATVYQDLKVNGNIDIDGEMIIDSIATTDLVVTDTGLFHHIRFDDPLITGGGNLSYYEHITSTLTFGGPIPSTNFDINIEKTGKSVILHVKSLLVVGNNASAGYLSSNAIPTRFRPLQKVVILIRTRGFTGGSEEVGHAVLETNGTVVIYPNLINGSVFTPGNNSGGGGVLDEMVFNYIN
jgi:hypothetical protein